MPIGQDFGVRCALSHLSPDHKSELPLTKAPSFRLWLRSATSDARCYEQPARFKLRYDAKLCDCEALGIDPVIVSFGDARPRYRGGVAAGNHGSPIFDYVG